MKTKQYSVNEKGLNEIKNFLSDNHKKGDNFTDSMIRAWAADAVFQLCEGDTAIIEIRAWGTVSGHTETLTISDDGLDCEEIEIEE